MRAPRPAPALEGRAVETVVVVGLVVLGALGVLVARLRSRVRSLEREAALRGSVQDMEQARLAAAALLAQQDRVALRFELQAQARLAAAVQEWAAREVTALRDDFRIARVDQSAAEVLARLAQKRAASAAPPPEPTEEEDPEERRDTIAMPAPSAPALRPFDEEGEPTSVYGKAPRLPPVRLEPMRPPPPRARPTEAGTEDDAAEASRVRLGPNDPTPRRARASMVLPKYVDPKGSAS